jgi:conjugal transfer pilus assembly protein TraL
MDEEDYWIPRHLDAPPLLFLWEADSAILVVFWLIVGGVLNMFLLGLVLAIVFGRGYATLKEEGGRGLLMKILYWYTPSELWLSKRIPSHIREYIGG